jgi:hypothetical protein
MNPRILYSFILLIALNAIVLGQTGTERKLTTSEQALVDSSKQAILRTGISELYFAAHFKLLQVIDKPADRRVMWQFTVDQHQAVLNDAIGSYASGTVRVNTHSIEKLLGQTTEIQRTITRARALRLMKTCIGNFDNPGVEYGAVNGRAELFMVAFTRPRTESEREKERERKREEREKPKTGATGIDALENEEEGGKHKPVLSGAINLQTGKCTKGAGATSPFAN